MTSATKAVAIDRTGPRSALTIATLIGLVLLVLAGCTTTSTTEPVTVPQIVERTRAGLTPDQIIGTIKASQTAYRLNASQLADLEEKGVAPAVIDYMQKTYLDSVRRDQAMADQDRWTLNDDGFWYGRCSFRWGPGWC